MTRIGEAVGSAALALAALFVVPLPAARGWPLWLSLAAALGLALALYAGIARARPRLPPLEPAVIGAAALLAVGAVREEIVWRWLLAGGLQRLAGAPAALALSTAAFALAHSAAQGRRGCAVHAATGAGFGGLYLASGSLAAAITAHASYNGLVLGSRAVAGRRGDGVLVRGAVKRLAGRLVLDGFDLDVAPGEIVTLLGPNGAGKSTAIAVVVGLRRPDAGLVLLNGTSPRARRARLELGYAGQECAFPLTLTVREVVEVARAHYARPRATEELLERFGLEAVQRRLCGGLSGGQRRRLALALAFAGDPRLVVLDEPSAGLDVEGREALEGALRELAARGGSALVTTHVFGEAERLSTRIVVLDRGRVLAEGTPVAVRGAAASLREAYARLREDAR